MIRFLFNCQIILLKAAFGILLCKLINSIAQQFKKYIQRHILLQFLIQFLGYTNSIWIKRQKKERSFKNIRKKKENNHIIKLEMKLRKTISSDNNSKIDI